jgi:hypothetical protein
MPVVVTLTRVGPRTLDSDNLQASLKAVRDATASWLRVSDSPASPVEWRYGSVKVSCPSYATVRIESAQEVTSTPMDGEIAPHGPKTSIKTRVA